MNDSQRKALQKGVPCPLHVDSLTRQLFATDGSIYQIEPAAVAFPRGAEEASKAVAAAADAGVAVIPRGAGTGLAGGALGAGMVVEFSRFNRAISEFDREARTIRVESGVVLDQLNGWLAPHGLCFGPDVATSSRATLGGMIANNSSGSKAPYYGTTIDHVESVDVVMSDGTRATVGPHDNGLPEIQARVAALVESHRGAVDERMPPGLVKRWPGYGFDRWLRHSPDLSKMIGGSEGTLAAITSAVLRLSPIPERRGLGAICFASVTEAMAATTEIQPLRPVAIEHIDRVLFDQTRGQLTFREARALLELDHKPCEAILLIEFFEDIDEKLDQLMALPLGLRRRAFTDTIEMEQIWSLRKAGLSLLTGCKGSAKPTAGIEDVAVRPEQLPDYVNDLHGLMSGLGLHGSFYGHAASGLLHVRPVVDLHKKEDLVKFRRLGDEVSALVKQYRGAIAAEHGLGIARTEYLADHLGPELMAVVTEVKRLFDPKNVFNPGKIVSDGRFRFDTNLRQGEQSEIPLPFEPQLAFAMKDEGFAGNLEQCNGCGGCRKAAPTMCPTYQATGLEIMSTRGRANTIRAVLEARIGKGKRPLKQPELAEALDYCLSCKACTPECPSNVNMALLKAELLHAKHKRHGTGLSARVFSRVDLLGKMGSRMPGVANATLANGFVRGVMRRTLGIAAQRPLPKYARKTFGAWFQERTPRRDTSRGDVILWDDCFVEHNEPTIGQAAVRVLEAAGFRVRLAKGRACCGRPAFSTGRLDVARAMGDKNLGAAGRNAGTPIVFLEPSCYSMFKEDYLELKLEGAEEIAQRCFLIEDFLADLLTQDPNAIPFQAYERPVAAHLHCHMKAIEGQSPAKRLLERLPLGPYTILNTGCCGMAGSYGAMESKYDVSVKVAEPLVAQIRKQPEDGVIVASGTSCRHQIEHLCGFTPLHMIELAAECLHHDVR